ncbi:MAG TPA: 1,4-dihydroxy-2-naphthoate polyprenyltransferase [Thermomicrobiales bacterium]|nr:1,4-dihydroxy-2-naphthoate polyprenyltransferase [Thermomicrobiales bacterium]
MDSTRGPSRSAALPAPVQPQGVRSGSLFSIAMRPSSLSAARARWCHWVLASRPKTLPAAIAPVLAGTAVAIHEDGFHPQTASLALITALLLQIAANFANDALDFRRGADTRQRVGPARVTASGLIDADDVLRATALTLALATLTGLFLVLRGGWPLAVLGIAALICAVAYTGGPFPLGYLGLGEVFVFLFFGPVAVAGTAYVQTLDVTWLALATAVPLGALATGILVVNNLRDLRTDALANKRTIAVRIGDRSTRLEYGLLLLVALVAPPLFWFAGWLNWWWVLTLAWWPIANRLWMQITTRTGPALNRTLADTGRGLLLYSILLSLALILTGRWP